MGMAQLVVTPALGDLEPHAQPTLTLSYQVASPQRDRLGWIRIGFAQPAILPPTYRGPLQASFPELRNDPSEQSTSAVL